jgi:hypothetical protein
MTWLLIGIFLAGGLLIRLSFCGIGQSSDEWVTFWLIRRQQGQRWLTARVNNAVNPGTYAYPQLQHWLVSRFPQRWWGLVGRLLNAVYDLLVGVLLAVILSAGIESNDRTLAGLAVPAAVVLLFVTTPALLPSVARMRAIKARSFGLLLFAGWFIGLGLSLTSGGSGWLGAVGAIVLFQLIVLASAFALQATVFTAIGVSLFLLTPWPMVILLAGLGVAIALPRLGTREALWFFWSHKVWYVHNAQKGTTAAGRNRLRDMILLPWLLVRKPRRALWLLFWQNSFFIAAYSSPLVVYLIILWFRLGGPWGHQQPLVLAWLWGGLLGALIAFVLTSLKPLAFLGQAERYFEYAAPMTATLAVGYLAGSSPASGGAEIFWLLVGLHLLGVFLNATLAATNRLGNNLQAPPSLDEVADWLLENTRHARLATMSPKLVYVLSQRFAQAGRDDATFYYRLLVDGRTGMRTYGQEIGGPLLSDDRSESTASMELFQLQPDQLHERYGIDTLVIDRRYEASLRKFWGDQASRLDAPLFANSLYLVLRLGGPAGGES